ncbi:MAG: TIR domain-containing protein [Tidjanibacter sp.]|nr:TIR domain-containing protein [Tidjanibacter sp.]
MDVFISYSRKDKEQAEALCGALAEAGVDYWIDRSEIHGSANFLTEITRNIKACKVLIFIASANSAASEFTQKEILYALKRKKPIIPYKIGEFQFEDNDELDFVFTNVQWVESLEEVVRSLEKQGLTHKAQPEPVEQPTPDPQPQPQPKPKPQPEPTPTHRRWWLWALIAALVVVVGALLLGGSGEQGRHAKEKAEAERIAQERRADSLVRVVEAERHRSDSLAIMAQRLEKENNVRAEAERKAAEKAEQDRLAKEKAEAERIAQAQKTQPQSQSQPVAKTYKVGDLYDDGTKKGVVFDVSPDGKHGKIVSVEQAQKQWAIESVYRDKTGATSMSDGKANMQKIMAISGWREKYPAFAWCADLGEGWYLPARDELKAIYKAIDIINATLSANGCTELNTVYWSSSEDGTYGFCAWLVYMHGGYTYDSNKDGNVCVRAVSAF